MFVKGDIILPKSPVKRRNMLYGLYHAAVVWDDFNDGYSDFNGIMLTHAPPNKFYDNIIMKGNHFDSGFKFGFNNTHFVNQIFIKFTSWGPFKKVGELTTDGISFLESNLTNVSPVDYISYRAFHGI